MSQAWPALFAGRSLKRTTSNRAPGRHPMPCPCSRHPLSTRFTQRAVVFAPLGLPARLRSYPRHCPGLSVRGGPMRVDGATTPEPIHQMARGLTSPPMPKPRPQRPAGITTPMAAEMHGWAGSTRFVFKTDRVGERGHAGRRIPWVGAATPWSRAVPKFLTTDRRGQRNPSRRELPWIPFSSPTSACRSGGGPPAKEPSTCRT